jgi:hypothetical protein
MVAIFTNQHIVTATTMVVPTLEPEAQLKTNLQTFVSMTFTLESRIVE